MKKERFYVIELGGKKEINEMKALELKNINQAIIWIEDSIESDKEYFNIDIDFNIKIIDYEFCGNDLDFYCQAFVSTKYNSIVTYEMIDSEVFDIKDIIESNLSIISKIKLKMVKE